MPKFLTHIEGTENLLAQGSPEWRELRMGRATASNFDRILTEVKGEYAAGAASYAREIAVQRVLREDTEKPISGLYWVERGTALEPDAVKHYEKVRGRTTNAIGLIISDDGTRACSPDRIGVDRLWGVEIKCLSGPEHLQYMKIGPGRKYLWQVVGSMLVAGFDGWDLCAYHPNLREVIIPYRREDYAKELKQMDDALNRFEGDVQEYCDLIRSEGFVDPMTALPSRPDSEWQQMLAADKNLWAIA